MRNMFGLVLILGLGLAGLAVYMAKNYISDYQMALANERANRAEAIETVEIYVSKRALSYGEPLLSEDVRLVKFPTESLPEGTFATLEELFPKGDDAPRVVLRAMEINEAIMAIKVTDAGETAGLMSKLDRGMRAFTIKVDVSSGVSGFLRTDDRVDVYWTGRVNSQSREGETIGEITKLIEARVRLIAVDQTSGSGATEATIARTVTVAVSPQQVAALAQAQATGNLTLSLVGTEDDTIAEAIEVDQRSLLGLVSAPVAAAIEAIEVCTIRTRRGGEVINMEIPCTN
ncbi:MAG: Flp pilus assembly protein CpaB [Rhodobacterales bacterium]|nr:Flp pilus assembly protein CpaB [Rhodobacterales bacterium]